MILRHGDACFARLWCSVVAGTQLEIGYFVGGVSIFFDYQLAKPFVTKILFDFFCIYAEVLTTI